MTSKEAYNYLLGLLESGGDMRWSLVKESMDKFKELIEQQSNSTLLECIKVWVDKGFIVNNNDLYIFLHHEQQGISMFINKEEIKYHTYYGYISLELNELLTKTLKALEVENE